MTSTQELIRQLVEDIRPVWRLRPPLLRAGAWVAVATVFLTMVATAIGVRPDLNERLRDSVFVTEVISAALTGITAAVAAFYLALPDRSRRWILLPVPSLLLWLSTIGYGCLTNWIGPGPSTLAASISTKCLVTMIVGSTPLAAVLLFMLRHARFVRAKATAAVAAIAVAGLTVSAMRLFHELDTTVMVLIWNVGAGTAITLIGTLLGRRVLSS